MKLCILEEGHFDGLMVEVAMILEVMLMTGPHIVNLLVVSSVLIIRIAKDKEEIEKERQISNMIIIIKKT
jgi:hypothetical protein